VTLVAGLVVLVLGALAVRRLLLLGAAALPARPTPPGAEPLPNVALVVPACNEAAGIDATLAAIARLDYPADRLFVALVDDCSDDATAEHLERWVVESWIHQLVASAAGVSPSSPFGAWIDVALGPGIARHFMVPYNEKVATVPVSDLTCEWLGRFVPAPPLAEIRAGATDARVVAGGYNRRFLYPCRGGIDLLSRSLARHVDRIRTGAAVVAIDTDRRRVRLVSGEEVPYGRAVIASVPLPAIGRMVAPRRRRRLGPPGGCAQARSPA
jgi:hypothetical protein